jgi:cytochrome oxidase Cu insertion factor (SCO1/SenC/PrrC family)
MYQNTLTNKILESLVPLVGKIMAESIIKVQMQKLNLDPEKLTAQQLPQIAERFAANTKIFVGTEKAEQLGALLKGLS